MRAYILAAVVLVGACGGGDATAPAIPNVAGRWTYNATSLTDNSGVVCNNTGFTMQLNQTGTTLTGTMGAGTISCTVNGSSYSVTTNGGDTLTGQISGNALWLDIDDPDWHNTLTIQTGSSMIGHVTIKLSDKTLSGDATMVRQL